HRPAALQLRRNRRCLNRPDAAPDTKAIRQKRRRQRAGKIALTIDSLPDMILPGLAYAASRRQHIPRDAVQAVVTYCGPLFLERCLGRVRSRELLKLYPKPAALSGLVRYDA
ncbi:hypothetical protein QCM77_44315, partial [Bradyrhizobium sp. SSUT18]|uniref:hypothetical protein n=1 Tax=Bradyrhizobium sp. SSUT18 TaxID=3040602 RepID=UPI00244CFE81